MSDAGLLPGSGCDMHSLQYSFQVTSSSAGEKPTSLNVSLGDMP